MSKIPSIFVFFLVSSTVCLTNTGCHHTAAVADSPKSASVESLSLPSVQTVTPERRDLVAVFEQPGIIEPVAAADLYSRVSGYVKLQKVDIGDRVRQGEILLEVDVPELAQELAFKEALFQQAEAELVQAEANVEAAQGALEANVAQVGLADAEVSKAESDQAFRQGEYERFSGLAASNAATKQVAAEKKNLYQAAQSALHSAQAKRRAVAADEIVLKSKLSAANADVATRTAKIAVAKADREKTRVLFDYAHLKTPFDGVITRRNVDVGDYVSSPGSDRATPLFTLMKIDTVTVVLRVPEKEVPAIRIGSPAVIHLDAFGDEEIRGQVSRMALSLEEKSRTMRVEVDLPNADGKLYPGMYGKMKVTLVNLPDALTVPATALYGQDRELFVVTIADNTARKVKVRTGFDNGSVVQILDGLQGDEQVVISNKGELADGQKVRATSRTSG